MQILRHPTHGNKDWQAFPSSTVILFDSFTSVTILSLSYTTRCRAVFLSSEHSILQAKDSVIEDLTLRIQCRSIHPSPPGRATLSSFQAAFAAFHHLPSQEDTRVPARVVHMAQATRRHLNRRKHQTQTHQPLSGIAHKSPVYVLPSSLNAHEL